MEKKKQFGLLVWNLHKENGTKSFNKTLLSLLQKFDPDILLFQETNLNANTLPLAKFHQENNANITLPTKSYGVLNASKFPIIEKEKLLTRYHEFFIATKKSLLITTHKIDDKLLKVVNLHAINFVPHSIFKKELHTLEKKLQNINTPLIVAGDFNTWSKTRLEILKRFVQNLDLKQANIENSSHIKCYRKKPLDHILYRSLHLRKATAIDTKNVSDHNALYALFEYNFQNV